MKSLYSELKDNLKHDIKYREMIEQYAGAEFIHGGGIIETFKDKGRVISHFYRNNDIFREYVSKGFGDAKGIARNYTENTVNDMIDRKSIRKQLKEIFDTTDPHKMGLRASFIDDIGNSNGLYKKLRQESAEYEALVKNRSENSIKMAGTVIGDEMFEILRDSDITSKTVSDAAFQVLMQDVQRARQLMTYRRHRNGIPV